MRWPGRTRPGTTDQVAISMDWVPTLLAAAGARADPGYPPDGIDLLPMLTRGAPPVPRKLFWRYRHNEQRAVREGDMKWLKIAENTFLFNVIDDPLERANLKGRQPEVYRRLVEDYEAWNATMLPEDPAANTHTLYSDQAADHYGNKRKLFCFIMELPPRSKGSPHGRKRTQTSSWRNLRTNREAVRQRIDHPAWRASCPGGPDHFDGIDFRRLRARDGRLSTRAYF